jgi:iron complex transport system ATP-binding protein
MSPLSRSLLLEARGLDVAIGERMLVRGLDLELRRGERLGILGRNGAGKSTLLSVLAGLRPPTAGSVRLGGDPYAEISAREAALRRGWLPQVQLDAFDSTVLETALIGRHPHLGRWQWEGRYDAEFARTALEFVGLSGIESRSVHSLSGGERQRLAVATLLTQEPDLYLLDEPLAHLDLNHAVAILNIFSAVAGKGAGVAMVLHEPGLAARYCDRVLLLMGDGEFILDRSETALNVELLSRLYGHPLKELRDGAERWFVPA